MSKLAECNDELTVCVEQLTSRYDVRHVVTALLARAAHLSAAAEAAGIEHKLFAELWAASVDQASVPPKRKPAVQYIDSETGEHLGRKQ